MQFTISLATTKSIYLSNNSFSRISTSLDSDENSSLIDYIQTVNLITAFNILSCGFDNFES